MFTNLQLFTDDYDYDDYYYYTINPNNKVFRKCAVIVHTGRKGRAFKFTLL